MAAFYLINQPSSVISNQFTFTAPQFYISNLETNNRKTKEFGYKRPPPPLRCSELWRDKINGSGPVLNKQRANISQKSISWRPPLIFQWRNFRIIIGY